MRRFLSRRVQSIPLQIKGHHYPSEVVPMVLFSIPLIFYGIQIFVTIKAIRVTRVSGRNLNFLVVIYEKQYI